MTIVTDQIQISLPEGSDKAVIMLPARFLSDAKGAEYYSTAISFYKMVQKQVPVQFASEPLTLLDQRSGDWFAPAMAITNQFINDHPLIVSILCGVIANYVTALMSPVRSPQVHVNLIIERSRGKNFVNVAYTGDVEGMRDVIEKAVEIGRAGDADA